MGDGGEWGVLFSDMSAALKGNHRRDLRVRWSNVDPLISARESEMHLGGNLVPD